MGPGDGAIDSRDPGSTACQGCCSGQVLLVCAALSMFHVIGVHPELICSTTAIVMSSERMPACSLTMTLVCRLKGEIDSAELQQCTFVPVVHTLPPSGNQVCRSLFILKQEAV